MTVGVLAFQGNFAEHIVLLKTMEVKTKEVRTLDDLKQVTHLIIPGGESTVIAKFLFEQEMDQEIIRRSKAGSLPVFGTCAGAILLATKVTGKNPPKTLGLIDMVVERNAYGTQSDSFEQEINVKGLRNSVPASFIRAPIIESVGNDVEVLAKHGKSPILVRQGDALAATFHEEVRGQTAIHRMFLRM